MARTNYQGIAIGTNISSRSVGHLHSATNHFNRPFQALSKTFLFG